MVAASAPTVAASTASWAVAAPVGAAPLPTACAATASAAVISPAAVPRSDAAGLGEALVMVAGSGQTQSGHQVGVDAVELMGDRGMRGTATRRGHVLGGRHRR